ncbi:MAG: metallophosphoesterase, partial [Steroidobacter sp.]
EPVAKAMKDFCAHAPGCDFAAMLGDNIYPDGATGGADGRDAERFRDLFITPFAPLANGRVDFRIYTVLGNHDWNTSREGAIAQVRFLETTPPFYMDGLFYRVKPPAARGEVEIFAIDTEVLLSAVTVRKAQLADAGSEMQTDELEPPEPWAVPQSEAERNIARWLDDALKSSTARWKIVLGHHPLWSTSGSKFEQARALRQLILPSLCRYADAYLAGHEHTLEVHTDDCSAATPGERVQPLPQIVSGSAAKMRPTNTAFIRHQVKTYPQLQTLYAKGLVWGFAHLTFDGGQMTVRIVETPSDGSGATRVTYEHSFAHRRRHGEH